MISKPRAVWLALGLLIVPASAAAQEDDIDHDVVVGHVGIGLLGARLVPSTQPHPTAPIVIDAAGNVTVQIEPDDTTVPLFGIRYWFTSRVGLELGAGFGISGGNETRTIPNPDPALGTEDERSAPSALAFDVRAGLPISLAAVKHVNFLLIPELDVGYSSRTLAESGTSTTGETLDLHLTGLVFGAGARLGLELSFGFFEVPELSLQAAFGARYEHRRFTGQIGDAETTVIENRAGTSFDGGPWDVVVGCLGLLYYL
jgi:hypothetical protein